MADLTVMTQARTVGGALVDVPEKLHDNGDETYSRTMALQGTGGGSRQSAARPDNATPYTAGDVVGGVMTFPVGPAEGGEVIITGAALEIDVAAVPSGMTSFTVHLYNVTPPSALVDNAAWDLPSGDRAAYLGFLTLGTPVDKGSTLYVQEDKVKQVSLLTANLFAYLVTDTGYTPTALAVKALTLHTVKV